MCFDYFRSLANGERPEDLHKDELELSFTPEQNSPEQSHCLSHLKVKSILNIEPVNYIYALCCIQQRRPC